MPKSTSGGGARPRRRSRAPSGATSGRGCQGADEKKAAIRSDHARSSHMTLTDQDAQSIVSDGLGHLSDRAPPAREPCPGGQPCTSPPTAQARISTPGLLTQEEGPGVASGSPGIDVDRAPQGGKRLVDEKDRRGRTSTIKIRRKGHHALQTRCRLRGCLAAPVVPSCSICGRHLCRLDLSAMR